MSSNFVSFGLFTPRNATVIVVAPLHFRRHLSDFGNVKTSWGGFMHLPSTGPEQLGK